MFTMNATWELKEMLQKWRKEPKTALSKAMIKAINTELKLKK